MTKKVYIKSYGCQMNVYDSGRMADILAREGFTETLQPEGADGSRDLGSVGDYVFLSPAMKSTCGNHSRFEGIDVSESEFLGSYAENVAGHKAVRMDFRCRSKAGVAAGDKPQIISIFLLPMDDIAFPQPYLGQLEKEGHYCQPCISYAGTIYCVRKNDLFVAAVSNLAKQELAAVVNVR